MRQFDSLEKFQVSVPYNANPCQQPARCVTTQHQTAALPGVSVFEVPITVPVNIVPPELFPHPLPVNTVSAPMPTHGNVVQMMAPQQQIPTQQVPPQQLQPLGQQQPDEQAPDLMTFQMCQQNDLLYTNMDATSNHSQRQQR